MPNSIAPMPALSTGVFTDTPSRDVAVSVRGLSKSYSIAKNAVQHTSAGEAIMHKLRHPFEKVERDTFWALNDVNFDIQKGDVVGIIGRNGAGKSTLLKILSRITEPTKGRIDLYGRVGSLLEVGTGFHPELTGRENIYLNGAILGMQKSEITRQFDAIVEFAGVEQFLDTPVKRYSSGMYVRLAFAVAAHLNPEILIVDEVLAVGDAEFQKKCMGKMQDVADSGRTVLFVSHNMGAIADLCSSAILMSYGKLTNHDNTDNIISNYLGEAQSNQLEVKFDPRPVRDSDALFRGCRITDLNNSQLKSIDVRYGFRFGLDVTAFQQVENVEVSIRISDMLAHPLFTINISDTIGRLINLPCGDNFFTVDIPSHFLAPGRYNMQMALHRPNVMILDEINHVLSFEVEETGSGMWRYNGVNNGNILVRFPWKHTQSD